MRCSLEKRLVGLLRSEGEAVGERLARGEREVGHEGVFAGVVVPLQRQHEEVGAGDRVPVQAIFRRGGQAHLPGGNRGAFMTREERIVGEELEGRGADGLADVAELIGEFEPGFDGAVEDAGERVQAHLHGREHIHAAAGEGAGLRRLAGAQQQGERGDGERDGAVWFHGGMVEERG